MAVTPTMYPILAIFDTEEDNEIMYVPFALVPWNNGMYPIAIDYHDNGLSLAIMDNNEAQAVAEDTEVAFTRHEVLFMYMRTAHLLMADPSTSDIEKSIMQAADPYIAKMLEDEAHTYGKPIQYLKSLIARGIKYHLLTNYLDHILDAYATQQLCNKKAQVIQQYFRRVVSDPIHDMCKRRLCFKRCAHKPQESQLVVVLCFHLHTSNK